MSSSSSTSKELQCVCLLFSSAAIGGTSSSIFTSGELCLLLLKYFVESGAELMGITPRLLSVIKEILISEGTKLEGHCSQDLGCAWSPSVSHLSFWTGRSTGSTWNIANDPCGSSMNILSANVQGLEYWTDTSYQKRKNVLTLDWNSRASYGSPLVKSLFNKMSAKKNLKEATEAMTRIMKMAAEDEYTGGVFSLFRGGTSKWGNIHSEVPKRKRSFIDKRYVMDEYQNPLDKKVVFEVAFQVFGDLCLKPLEEGNANMNENMLIIDVEDFNVYVPNDYMLVSELKELIRHGSCASMLKYPTIFSSRIILRMGKNFLRDDDRVWPYERTIDVLVEEEFIVKVYIDGEPFTVAVTEMTAARHIKARLMKLNPDMDLRSKHLTYKDRKVGRNLLMYDLGVRSVPDKKGLLWKTNGSKDPMAKLREMQKAYNFKLVKIMQ